LGHEVRGEENGDEVSPPHPTLERRELPQRARGGDPAENGFIVIQSPQIASVDS